MSLDEIVQEAPPFRPFRLEISKNILDQDYRRIDDDPEVDRAQRQKVRILASDYEKDDGEKQRERNIRADDNGATQIPEKKPLDEKHEETAEHKVVQDRVGGNRYQRSAVVKGNDFDSRRQGPVRIYFLDFGLDKGQDLVRMLCPAHDDDCCGDVIVVIVAGNGVRI
jgi:hypothetical protein